MQELLGKHSTKNVVQKEVNLETFVEAYKENQ